MYANAYINTTPSEAEGVFKHLEFKYMYVQNVVCFELMTKWVKELAHMYAHNVTPGVITQSYKLMGFYKL